MTTLHLTVTLSQDRAQRLQELARSLNVSADLLAQSIVDSDMKRREIDDKTMSDSDIFSVVANSPLAKALLPNPAVRHVNGESAWLEHAVDQRALPHWERLIITQDVGLPMRWNAQLHNITTGAVASSDPGATAEAFLHEELHQALSALHEERHKHQPDGS